MFLRIWRVRDGIKTTSKSLLCRLHPRLAHWFGATFADFTDAQLRCVPSILKRKSILLTSPTGSGKTLAAFLGIFDHLLRELDVGSRSLGVRCLYISPLRALTYDIGKNLRAPITGMGLEKELLIHVRTGDTSAGERTRFRRKPSHYPGHHSGKPGSAPRAGELRNAPGELPLRDRG